MFNSISLKNILFSFILILALFVAYAYLPKIIIMAVWISGLAILISYLIKRDIIVSIVYSITLTTIIFGLIASFLTLINKDSYIFAASSFIFTLSSAVIVIYSYINGLYKHLDLKFKGSLFALLISSIFFLFLIYPYILEPNIVNILHRLTAGEDHASHFSIYNYILTNSSLAYQNGKGLLEGLINYPQGIHGLLAYIAYGLPDSATNSITKKLYIYFLSFCIYASLLIFIYIKILTKILKNGDKISFLISGLSLFIIISIVIMPIIQKGYYLQILVLLYSGVFIDFLININTKTKNYDRIICALLCLVCIGLLLTWYQAVILFAPFFLYLTFKKFKKIFLVLLLFTPVLLLSLVPSWFHLRNGNAGSALISENIQSPFFIPAILYILLLVIFLVLIKHRYILKDLISKISTSMGLMVILFLFLSFALIGSLNYFFYKMLILIVPVFLFSALLIYKKITSNGIQALIIGLILVLGIGYYSILEFKGFTNYISSSDSMVGKEVISEISPLITNDKFSDLIYLNQCSPLNEYLLSRWSSSIFLSYSDLKREIEMKLYNDSPVINDINLYSNNNHNVYLYQTPSCNQSEI